MKLNHNDIENLEARYRANFINSLGGFKSVALIGTRSAQHNDNLAIFSSIFHIGADPAICGMIVRPNEIKQNTLGNILETKHFTINHILSDFYKQAHQCSAKYEDGESEFEKVGLTPEFIEDIKAPFVRESKIKFACELIQKTDIELNGTTLIIGKIIKVVVPGDPGLTVGKTVVFNIYNLSSSGENKELDPYYSGKYLVNAVRHVLQSQGAYQTVMELAKESYETPIGSTNSSTAKNE